MSDSFNPYSPPRTPVTRGSLEAQPRRPRAIKWATFILGMFTVAVIVNYWRMITRFGAEAVWQQQLILDPSLLPLIGFGLCLFGRNRMAYYGIVGVLGFQSFRYCWLLIEQWLTPTPLFWMNFGERAGEFMASFSLCYLFYRVTFGLPSRHYYGLVKAPAPDL